MTRITPRRASESGITVTAATAVLGLAALGALLVGAAVGAAGVIIGALAGALVGYIAWT